MWGRHTSGQAYGRRGHAATAPVVGSSEGRLPAAAQSDFLGEETALGYRIAAVNFARHLSCSCCWDQARQPPTPPRPSLAVPPPNLAPSTRPHRGPPSPTTAAFKPAGSAQPHPDD
ncbi:unnamed protein product [Lampetra planeri]